MNKGMNRRKRRFRAKFEKSPPVHSIKDLIEIGKHIKFYTNLDTIMLWRITPYLEELDSLVGMDGLKNTLFYQVIYYLKGMHKRNEENEYLHTVIMGAPGCGKTTVAKIIGQLYRSMGVLSSSGRFKVAYRDDFVAEYVGQTAIKTRKLLKSCIGGVLFIDEVYSLGDKENRDTFSKEAIDTITGFLSEHKNDFCCIIAGYEREIKECFFSFNKGLQSRFPWIHKIEDYSPANLAEITSRMITSMKWETTTSEKDMKDFYSQYRSLFKHSGRDIETFLTKAKMMHAKRVFNLSSGHQFILTMEDFNSAISVIRSEREDDKEDIIPGLYT